MIKVYAVLLVVGLVGLVYLLVAGAFETNRNGGGGEKNERFGVPQKAVLGAILGFSMAGMAAEYSPLDLSWPIALLIAFAGLGLGVVWVRYAAGLTSD